MKSDNSYMLSLAAENLSTVLCFANSRASFFKLREAHNGRWQALNRLLFELPEKRADRALLEMAYLTRAIDNLDGISDAIKGTFGILHMEDGNTASLSLRDTCNKIIHASRYEWVFDDSDNPVVICVGEKPEQWTYAQVLLNELATAFGQLDL